MVSIYYLRESRAHPSLTTTSLSQNVTNLDFKIPENLKILPNDSAEERKHKRKKLKHLKQRHKNGIIERNLQSKKGKWQLFNERAKLKAKGHFNMKRNSNSIFKTTVGGKVGVMGSGKGMTTYREKRKYQFKGVGDRVKKRLKTTGNDYGNEDDHQ